MDKYPYNSLWGLFFSHIGWMLFTQERPKNEVVRVCVADIDGDWIVAWQHRHYLPIALFCSLVTSA
jgi:stearoyl-CoA desaturase (delta-9 desaturase)